MANENQWEFVRRHADRLAGPVLEVGSKEYAAEGVVRGILADAGRAGYVGADLQPGEGVDVVVDLAEAFDRVDAALEGRQFRTILCVSVLEHCTDPFAMARNLTRLLADGGHLVVSVPFAWDFHAFPNDYWRFTPEGIKLLFPELTFDPALAAYSTSRPGTLAPLTRKLGRITIGTSEWRQQRRIGRYLAMGLLKLLRDVGIARWVLGHRYLFPPVEIHMLGRKAGPTASPDAPA